MVAGNALPSVVRYVVDDRVSPPLVPDITPPPPQGVHNHSPVSSVICSQILVNIPRLDMFLSSLSTFNASPSSKIAQHAMT
jgi:hypothetical protein